jgi:RsiW-degrading membrane proteinase PrsW (M82 family)
MNKQNKKRMVVTGLLILLFALGMTINEGDFLGGKHTSVTMYLQVYSAFLLLLAYIVPFYLLMKQLGKQYKICGYEMLIAGACGAFISSPLAGEINDGFTDAMSRLMGRFYSDAWMGSAEAGIVEELLKLGIVAMLVYLFHRKTWKDYLSMGMCVGIGFQIDEDLSYITQSGFKQVNSAFPTALDRVVASLGSHWVYTGITAIGLYLIVRSCEDHHKKKGLFWIFFVMVDHFLYDTPIGNVPLFSALLSVAILLPLIVFLRSPKMTNENVQKEEKG